MNNKPEKLILDYSKWRCGYNNNAKECPNQLGKGTVRLKNDDGYFCCLGLFSIQLGATEEDINDVGRPYLIGKDIPILTTTGMFDMIVDTDLSGACIEINDDEKTTPDEKIEKLTAILKQEGIQLEVINKP